MALARRSRHVIGHGDSGSALGPAPTSSLRPFETITAISSTRTDRGYWLYSSFGRVFAYGDAQFFGDMRTAKLNGPVPDSILTASGSAYYMVASDGGIFTFGDATFLGSMGAAKLNALVQSLVPDGDGSGYWLVASDGGIFAFDAEFYGKELPPQSDITVFLRVLANDLSSVRSAVGASGLTAVALLTPRFADRRVVRESWLAAHALRDWTGGSGGCRRLLESWLLNRSDTTGVVPSRSTSHRGR